MFAMIFGWAKHVKMLNSDLLDPFESETDLPYDADKFLHEASPDAAVVWSIETASAPFGQAFR